MTTSVFLAAILAAMAPTKLPADCGAASLIRLIDARKDVYLGEIHGTEQAPALVACLAQHAMRGQLSEKLIVSLELPENARDLNGAFWHQTSDGRSSWAMWNLVRQLLQHEKEGQVEIRWQDGRNEFPNNDRERYIGESLLESSKRGLLIALSGNLHSSKAPMPFAPGVRPAGMYVGSSAVHVFIDSVSGGSAWYCSQTCGTQNVNGTVIAGAAPGAIVDGLDVNHDFIFFVSEFTASPPRY
jgi:hypothetical protein